MNPWLLGFVVAAGLAGCVAGWRLLSTVRRWRGEILASVELTQRQLTELRSAQDALAATVEENAQRLRHEVEPRLSAIQRYLQAEETAAEVERARQAGTVGEETAQRLLEELERLGQRSLSGDSPH